MDWIELVQWLATVAGAIVVVTALVMGTLVWFLNHPD